jgi:hypothetical protein
LTAFRHAVDVGSSKFDGVVLIENNGADLAPFREIARGRPNIELLSTQSPHAGDVPVLGLSRGFLETELVHDAMAMSSLVAAHPGCVVWKITGRYRVLNIARLAARSAPGCDLYFNLRRYPRTWADMWIYGTTVDGIRLLFENIGRLREHQGPAEREMFNIISELAAAGHKISTRFPIEPRISGIRGYEGLSFDSPKQRAKWVGRAVIRRVVPRLWI